MIVEHIQGFQWAEPLDEGEELQLERVRSELHIIGLLPLSKVENGPTDLIGQYEIAAKYRAVGKKRTTSESPLVRFANASSDDKLIAFVRRFGPVVAKRAFTNYEKPEKGLSEPRFPPRLSAVQDMQELRNEHLAFRSAVDLMMQLNKSPFDLSSALQLIGVIAAKIADWPRQWKREREERGADPSWRLSNNSLKRIEQLKHGHPDPFLEPALNGQIVLCELLNSFRSIVFPNPLEMHASIKYGIRPLLYAILRRQFVTPRDISICENTHCRNVFDVERGGQQFCSPGCSLHQRQRIYWAKRGKKLRRKRTKEQRKAKK